MELFILPRGVDLIFVLDTFKFQYGAIYIAIYLLMNDKKLDFKFQYGAIYI